MAFAVPTDFSNTKNTNYEPVPADNHVGICVGLIDLGTHMERYMDGPEKPTRKVKIQFELPGVERTDGKAAVISMTTNYSMNEKATLRKMLDGWLGADWTEKAKGKSWNFLIGIPAMVNVEHRADAKDASRTFAFIKNVTRFPKGMPAPAMSREPFYLDLDEKFLPQTLSVHDAEKIRSSREYQAAGFRDDAPHPEAGGNGNGNTPPPAKANGPFPNVTPTKVAPCPPGVAAVLARNGMVWPYRLDDYPDQISDEDVAILEPFASPF